uniref:Sugar phosphate transporter domain-containing protein n=1 Tax=Alexandrium monilatum TaxID=311494 RepID=A0A7S4VKR6_9DINO
MTAVPDRFLAAIGVACLILGGVAVDAERAGSALSDHGGYARFMRRSKAQRQDGTLRAAAPGQPTAVGARAGEPPAAALWGPLGYLLAVVGTASVVALLYWSRSAVEICSIVLYLLALSTVRLSVKAVFVGYDYKYPLAVSAVHFVAAAAAAFGALLHRQKFQGRPVPVPSLNEFLFTILPIAVCFATCIGVGNKVLDLCSVALTEILMATQPLMSIPIVVMLGMPFDMRLLWPTSLVVAGCIVCSLGDVRFSGLGLALAILSNVLRAAKASLQQKMLTSDQRDRFDPCALLAWMSLPSAVLMVLWSAAAEGLAPVLRLVNDPGSRLSVVLAVLLSSVPATILNLSQLFVVAGLGAVGSQIVGQLKIALTILGGVALLSERVSPIQTVGFVAVLVGTFVYSRWDQASKAEAALGGRQQKEPLRG